VAITSVLAWGQPQQPGAQQVIVFSTSLTGFTAPMKALMNFPSA
jgi:hypothetical protein